ncbi:DHH family phosphoesterase [Candidatus Woesearchaeota archaeon]|nr:DHH family phosphoesterase [Candidatus Woesearchaeota archaeon]
MEFFLNKIKEGVNKLKKLSGVVKIITHIDADGLSSGAIIIKALQREGINFSFSSVRLIDENVIDEMSRENCDIFLFLDLGSGSLSKIDEKLGDREVFILDHHKLEDYDSKKIFLINPHKFNLDGGVEISSSGICYFFAKYLNSKNQDLAHIALLGAIGDMQENNGFKSELNDYILQDAINEGKIEVKVGLRMFGMQTRPINKVLEYSIDPYIPGVTGNEGLANRFIEELEINATIDGRYKKLVQLDKEDMKKLVAGIILKRIGVEENPDDILGSIYLLTEEEDESPMKDAKEFSTLLNSCGRMNKASLGIGCCLGDKKSKNEALMLLNNYKREIINALNWYNLNKDKFIEENGYVIIDASNNIRDTLIGTLGSILCRSNLYGDGTIVITMAYTIDGSIKISLRLVGKKEIDLREVINNIINKVGGVCGGHRQAAGALIDQEKEEEFIKITKLELNKLVLEENANGKLLK